MKDMASRNIKRIVALEKVTTKVALQERNLTPSEVAGALKLLYDDPRDMAHIIEMVAGGRYSPPVHHLESKFEDSRESSERYRMMCR
ncbi:hypothetical protein ACQFZR_001462 [Raoultella ornithinolytica]